MMGDPEEDQQADDVYNQILGEIGMNMNAEMSTGSGAVAAAPQAAAIGNAQDDDLQSRLNALKGGQ